MFRPLGLPAHRYSELISARERQEAHDLSLRLPITEIQQYHLDDVAIGEEAVAGALRFYTRGHFEDEPHGETVLRYYFKASLLTVYAIRRLLKTYAFTCVCMVHGIYVPHGLIRKVAHQQNVRSVSWAPEYRKQTFIFSHHDTYHHTMLTEPTADWENLPWNAEMEAEILEYLKSRWYGTRDWVVYQKNHPQEDVAAISAELGVDFSKPCIGLLTNVLFDAQIFYAGKAFSNTLEWVLQTIEYFANRPDLQLIIRVHPAELRGTDPSRQPIIPEIRQAFPTLPKNVFIIPPESSISTYVVMLQCDTAIIYGTKAGVELTSMGIPVLVAGEAWIRNKGVTMDASSPDEYFRLLNRLPLKERLNEATVQRARKYAYHYFFRRMIPLSFVEPTRPIYQLALSGINDLLPGQNVGLDVVCNGILNGDKFIYPAEFSPETLNNRVL